MQLPFDGEVEFDFYTQQLPKMIALEEHSNGSLIGFSAFDPTRCVKQGLSDEEIVLLIDKSLSYEKVGFKFYPPMGYRAYNQTKHDRHLHFEQASFGNLIDSVAGLAAIMASQFLSEDFSHGDSYLALNGYGPRDGFESSIGGYFRIRYPSNVPESQKYDFDHSDIDFSRDIFQCFTYS